MKALFGTGGAVRLGGLAEGFRETVVNNSYEFDIVAGISATGVLAPIACLALKDPSIFDEVRELAINTSLKDIFPGAFNSPINRKGKLTLSAIIRLISGKNSLGIQNIRPVFEKVFPKSRFDDFKKTDPICLVMCVEPRTAARVLFDLKKCDTYEELVLKVDLTSRIMFWTQPGIFNGKKFVDGGMRNHTPSPKVLREYPAITEVVSVWSRPKIEELTPVENWDDDALSVLERMIEIMSFQISRSDEEIENLICEIRGISPIQIFLPYLKGLYNTDPTLIRKYIEDSAVISRETWLNFKAK